MKIGQMKEVEVDAKVLKLYLKVCDMFTATLVDKDNDEIFCQDDGYVPGFMPGDHDGDYVILDIDIDTGQILNWNAPNKDELQQWINTTDE